MNQREELERICESWVRDIRAHSSGLHGPNINVLRVSRAAFDRYGELTMAVPGAQALRVTVVEYPESWLVRGVAVVPATATPSWMTAMCKSIWTSIRSVFHR